MKISRVGILVNPIAGRGRAEKLAAEFEACLTAQKLSFVRMVSRPMYSDAASAEELSCFLKSVDLLVVAGGDGTLRTLLPYLAEIRTPVAMLPAGNESLFARAFCMPASPQLLIEFLLGGTAREHFFASANGIPFFSMVSAGLDSEVIDRIHRGRLGPIGHRGYFLPTMRSLFRHSPPVVTLFRENEKIIDAVPGFLVIANSPEYAFRLNPVPEADSGKGLLHARFYPHLNRFGYGELIIRRLLQAQPKKQTLFSGREFCFEIADGEYPVQADGERIGRPPFRVQLSEKTFPVVEKG